MDDLVKDVLDEDLQAKWAEKETQPELLLLLQIARELVKTRRAVVNIDDNGVWAYPPREQW